MIPDYLEALTAYRCWDVFPNGLLCGQAIQEPWPPYQPMVARCATTGGSWGGEPSRGYKAHVSPDGEWNDAPVRQCDCGIHGYKTLDAAQGRILHDPNATAYSFSGRPVGRAWGALKLWGKLVEHVEGYRAQFAYPAALFCEDATLAETIARLYGVPCELRTLDRPKPLKDDDDAMYWWPKPIYFQSLPTAYYAVSGYTVPSSAPAAAPVTQPGLIQTPNLAAIMALGANRYQQQQAAKQQARRQQAAYWREMMKKAFHAPGVIAGGS